MIFVTVGSRSFSFDRLIRAVDRAVSKGIIREEIFAQIGSGNYRPRSFAYVPFLDHDQFENKMRTASLVITHGGTGAIMNAVKMGKRVVAVPRLKQLGEAVDDNQTELIQALEAKGLVTACFDCDEIGRFVELARKREVIPYRSNADAIIASIDAYLDTI